MSGIETTVPNNNGEPMRKYIAEFIGPFSSSSTIGCTVIQGAPGVLPRWRLAAVLMVMVYAAGHVSRRHFIRRNLRLWSARPV